MSHLAVRGALALESPEHALKSWGNAAPTVVANSYACVTSALFSSVHVSLWRVLAEATHPLGYIWPWLTYGWLDPSSLEAHP